MSAIPSQLTSLDFFEIKESIRSYLRTRKEFSDYDFDGSSASYLLDILAYNTYYTAFNANMALNEAFLETATVRDNIIKVAKQLNYTPRSIKAAVACVSLTAQTEIGIDNVSYPEFATLKRGDVFIAENANDNYTFCLTRDVQVPIDRSTGVAIFDKILIYQGNLLNYDYTVDYTQKQDFIIPQENVDTSLIFVDISPNAQSTEIDTYNLNKNVTNLNSNSRVYFLEETDDLRYRLIFGDGVIGRKLIDGEYINISYVSTYGSEANGSSNFAYIGNIIDSDGRVIPPAGINLSTIDPAQQGEERETGLSIKFRAPRAYATQNRAVTESDYEHIVSEIYPQAASVTAYGGEKLQPPVYGKVYIAIRPKTGTKLNATTKVKIKNDLKRYTVASVEPVIIDPMTYYIIPKSYVYYNGNQTALSGSQLGTKLLQNIDQYNKANSSDRFGGRIDGSKFAAMIDNTDTSISGSVTQLTLGQNIDQFTFGNVFTQCLDFGNPLYNPSDFSGNNNGDACAPNFAVVKSGTFYATGYSEDVVDLQLQDGSTIGQITTQVFSSNESNPALVPVTIRDDGRGNLLLVTKRNEKELILNASVGSVDYSTGQVCVGPLAIEGTPDDSERLPIQVVPYGGSINIPPGVDPTIFNPTVSPIDYTINNIPIPTFDPNNFSGYNFGNVSGINIIDYPTDTFTYPVSTSCF
jgi:hypothetical protein